MPDAIAAALRELTLEVRALSARIDALCAERERRPPDEPAVRPLLHAIALATGGRKFTVAELFEHAEVVEPLRDAIVDVVGEINGRRLGKLLRRLDGRELDGLRVARIGADREGISWCVAGLRV